MSLLTLFNTVVEVLANAVRKTRKLKIHRMEKQPNAFISRYHDCLHRKLKNRKPATLISYYSKVAGYKVNIQKPITFPYASNEQMEFEIQNAIPLMLVPKQNNKNIYLDIDKIFSEEKFPEPNK